MRERRMPVGQVLILLGAVGLLLLILNERKQPPNGVIAFSRLNAIFNDIFLIDGDGNNLRQLTFTNNQDEYWPVWSPKGDKIAFQVPMWDQNDNNRFAGYEIYVMNSDGTNIQRLTNNKDNDYSQSWSPDGKQITFVSTREQDSQIYTMGTDGKNPKRLTNTCCHKWFSAWSPDGKEIAFVASDKDDNHQIYVMKLENGEIQQITHDTDDATTPIWSPNGQIIAYYAALDGHIYTVNSDGSNLRTILNGGNQGGLAWSPDTHYIAYTSIVDEDIFCSLYIVESSGQNAHLFLRNACNPSWRP